MKSNIEELNKILGLPKVVITNNEELSDDIKAVGLIINMLCDILSEKLGFDVHAELEKRIDEVETVD
jgi:hypothetical protein